MSSSRRDVTDDAIDDRAEEGSSTMPTRHVPGSPSPRIKFLRQPEVIPGLSTIDSRDTFESTDHPPYSYSLERNSFSDAPIVEADDTNCGERTPLAAPAYSFENLMGVRRPSQSRPPGVARTADHGDEEEEKRLCNLLKRDVTVTSQKGRRDSRSDQSSGESTAMVDRRTSKAADDDPDRREAAVFMPRKGSTSEENSDSKQVHPLVRLIMGKWDAFLSLKVVRACLSLLAQERSKILFYFAILVLIHGAVTFLLIVTLTFVMPGIWVYNFIQCFVILAGILSAVAGRMLSRKVRLSIMASDLVAGRANIAEISAYWVNGRQSPSHTVETVSFVIESIAEILLVACSILFKWGAVSTLVYEGFCIPPGPLYILQIMCEDGAAVATNPKYGVATNLNGTVVEQDVHSFLVSITITYPPGSVWNDITDRLETGSYQQHCSVKTTVTKGSIEYYFVSDLCSDNKYIVTEATSGKMTAVEANEVFLKTPDAFGAMPPVKKMILEVLHDKDYYPSQGTLYSNFLVEASMASNYYHSDSAAKGLAFGLGSAAHFAVNLVNGSETAPCDYWGYADAGQLDIPVWAVIAATIGSGIVILIKVFEILW
ncbi:hypothetical protein HK101_009815 [Irineochytrium annulatum]|nr:hypothetical protein HK101_009815 [Irineochytrium annulatum]